MLRKPAKDARGAVSAAEAHVIGQVWTAGITVALPGGPRAMDRVNAKLACIYEADEA